MSFLFSWFWGPLHRGFRGPLSRVWPSLPHLVSSWNSAGNCIGVFPSAPSVGCGLPYHIWSLLSRILLVTASGVFRVPPRSGVAFPTTSGLWLSGILLATASGVFRVPPRSGVVFLTTSGLYCLEFYWQLHWGFSECPLGRVWPSLPHLVSGCLEFCWQLLWDPNSTELNNNSTPTRSPTGSLKSNV